MPMTGKEMVKFLKKHGFVEDGQKGGHLKMRNPKTKAFTVVPQHSAELKKGMEQAILKQAGLKK